MREIEGVVLTPIPSIKYDYSRYGVDVINGRVWDHQNKRWLISNPNRNRYSYVGLTSAKGHKRSYGLHVIVMASHSAIFLEQFGRGKWEVDHMTPVSLGGGNEISNLQLATRHSQYHDDTRQRMSRKRPRIKESDVCEILEQLQEIRESKDFKMSEFIKMMCEAYSRPYRGMYNIIMGKSFKHLHDAMNK